jgi:cobyrinic acid a,c-diamide synthase
VVTFSPVAADPLPDCDAVYLPGGSPDLHGAALTGSRALATAADRASEGLPVFGECGGLLAAAASLTTCGETYAMAGILPAEVRLSERYQVLDRVEREGRVSRGTADTGTTPWA